LGRRSQTPHPHHRTASAVAQSSQIYPFRVSKTPVAWASFLHYNPVWLPSPSCVHGRTEHIFNTWRVLRSDALERGESPHNTSVLSALKPSCREELGVRSHGAFPYPHMVLTHQPRSQRIDPSAQYPRSHPLLHQCSSGVVSIDRNATGMPNVCCATTPIYGIVMTSYSSCDMPPSMIRLLGVAGRICPSAHRGGIPRPAVHIQPDCPLYGATRSIQ
jgi:hypothetical protein